MLQNKEDETITKLDLFVFEEICSFLSECRENDYYMAPVSVNITRRDLFYAMARNVTAEKEKYNELSLLLQLYNSKS